MLCAVNLSKSYSDKPAVKNISLNVESGYITGLLGPNGAGKSTLLRMLNRIIIPDSGSITFKNKPLTHDMVKHFGYLPEERGLYRKMKAAEQVMFFAQLKGLTLADARKQTRFWFERLELDAAWNLKLEQLSKGMQQKVQFISTVVHNPELLILDEPFSGFDPVNVELITRELIQFKKSGKAIVLSTHNMENVEALCDCMEMIHKGQLMVSGNINTIRKQYTSNSYVIEYRGLPMAFANALWSAAEIVSQQPLHEPQMHRVTIKLTKSQTGRSVLNLINNAVEITYFKEALPTVREIFMNQIQHHKPFNA
ncbi:MAG: hypothetical protein RIR05_435 [Bacteroidota bacterium]